MTTRKPANRQQAVAAYAAARPPAMAPAEPKSIAQAVADS